MVKKQLFQDPYNPKKTWLVCHMDGAKYLKQFIDGVQFGRGLRCNSSHIAQIGINQFKILQGASK